MSRVQVLQGVIKDKINKVINLSTQIKS